MRNTKYETTRKATMCKNKKKQQCETTHKNSNIDNRNRTTQYKTVHKNQYEKRNRKQNKNNT